MGCAGRGKGGVAVCVWGVQRRCSDVPNHPTTPHTIRLLVKTSHISFLLHARAFLHVDVPSTGRGDGEGGGEDERSR